jgi:hypothetical protein
VSDGGRGKEGAEVGRVRETHGACAFPSAVGVPGSCVFSGLTCTVSPRPPVQRSVLDFWSWLRWVTVFRWKRMLPRGIDRARGMLLF